MKYSVEVTIQLFCYSHSLFPCFLMLVKQSVGNNLSLAQHRNLSFIHHHLECSGCKVDEKSVVVRFL